MAKALRPNTIRARFGKADAQNAIHVTDLPDDGLREVKFLEFYEKLSNSYNYLIHSRLNFSSNKFLNR